MAVPAGMWLDLMGRDYLDGFIRDGGGAVRFAVAEAPVLEHLAQGLRTRAAAAGLHHVAIDLAATRLHMVQNVVFAVAAALPWERMVQARLEKLALEAGYAWPRARCAGTPDPSAGLSLLQVLADTNGVAAPLLRRDLTQALSRTLWQDARLTQDFRHAMIALLEARLTGEDTALADAVMSWLRGTLGRMGQVAAAQVGRRIGRQNARATLMSLCHFVHNTGGVAGVNAGGVSETNAGGVAGNTSSQGGLLLTLDIRRLHRERRDVAEGLVYTPAAVMDCYEVLRQLIDEAGHFPGLFVAVLADDAFLSDDLRRSLGQYTALQMRIWDDVRPAGGDNPLAPLVRVTA